MNSWLWARASRVARLLTAFSILFGGLAAFSLAVASPALADAASTAVSWADSQIGNTTGPGGVVWNGACLQFVADAWSNAGISIGSSSTALTYWGANPKGYLEHSASTYSVTPPAGALMFWGTTQWSTDGHVAISLGNGNVVSTPAYPYGSNPNAVFTFSLSQRPASTYNYLGWMMPGVTGSGSGTSAVQPVTTSDGHVQLFEVSNGVLEQNWYSPGDGSVGGWASPGAMPSGAQAAGNPAVVPRPGQSVIDVFVRSSDGQIRETWYNWGNGQWGGWITISGSTFTGDPQAVATSDGHDQVFADASGVIEQNWFSPGNGSVGGWVAI
jgi:cell wall-associated NlpC family hydrolase